MTVKFVPRDKFSEFIAEITKGFELYGHQAKKGEHTHMVRTTAEDIVLGTARAVEPLKAFLFPPREDLGEYFAKSAEQDAVPTALVGVTACNLRALKVLDHVFLGGDFKDPYYEKRRQNLLIVSMDCILPLDVCFCTFFKQEPYPRDGYDLNLSPLAGGKEGYLVEAGSKNGEELLAKQTELTAASEARIAHRDEQRNASTRLVDDQVKTAGLTPIDSAQAGPVEKITEKFRASREADAAFWRKHADKCVECGACNFICPACHCFLLVDVEQRGKFRRFKNWDSCLLLSFARVAGGANPRRQRVERLQNRFEKKFDFLPSTTGLWGCTGCGRCTEACAGDIDIREVLKDILASKA